MTTNPSPDDKALRKAWLKQEFGSFEYHEKLVRVHEKWRDVLRRALARAEQDNSPNRPESGYATIADEAHNFRSTTMPIIDRKPKPGDYKREDWNRFYAVGLFRSIPDYSRYLISEGDFLQWMTPDESAELNSYWGPMARMAQNIRYTVDESWDRDPSDNDWILDEKYTGPIDWPSNWREQIEGAQQPSIQSADARVKAGRPAPVDGLWQSVDEHKRQLRLRAGDVLPDLQSTYGLTLWERVGD
jgi:hypothetical protein